MRITQLRANSMKILIIDKHYLLLVIVSTFMSAHDVKTINQSINLVYLDVFYQLAVRK
jgi:hypothetical protein